MTTGASSLRVALLAGSLTQGGAEKQLVYMARALRERHVDVRVYCLTKGEYYEPALQRLELPSVWIGQHANPLVRTLQFARMLRTFTPHIVQAGHFFANLHVTVAARLVGAQAIGSLRNDAVFEVRANGCWGPLLLRTPPAIVANSSAAVRNAAALGARPDRIHIVSNVVDLDDFDGDSTPDSAAPLNGVLAVAACRLVRAKRIDRFLAAIALARRSAVPLRGVVVGDGPERPALERIARDLGLLPDAVVFLGRRDDMPAVLRRAHMLVVTSDHEGFPNVVLEAMAARLPVVTTPAGDAARIVRHGETGFVVPFEDTHVLADRLAELATNPGLRCAMGGAGRADVERQHSRHMLADRLLSVYGAIGERCKHGRLTAALVN